MKRLMTIKSVMLILLLIFSNSIFAFAENSSHREEWSEAEQSAYDNFPELRVLVKGSDYPFSYYENGTYKGIYPDYINKISDKAEIKLKYIPYESDEQLEALMTLGKADLIASVYGDWQGLYKASRPYTILEYNIIARKGNEIESNGAYTVAIPKDDMSIKNYIEEKYPEWTVVMCDDVSSALSSVDRGHSDLTLVNNIRLKTNMSLLEYNNLEVNESFSVYVPISLGVSSICCPEAMTTLLNRFIKCKPINTDESISRRYILNRIYVPNIREYLIVHKGLVTLICLAILAGIACMLLRWRKLKYDAMTDSLTKLWNKEKFIKEANKELKNNRDKEYLLASVDIEKFSLVNSRFGYEVGNQSLERMAADIKKIVGDSGIFARNTGDEFVVLIEDGVESRNRLSRVADICIEIKNTTHYVLPIKVGVCPISYASLQGKEMSTFLDRAKFAKSKINGMAGHTIVYFTDRMGEKLEKENELESIMHKSLQNNEFVVYYQPKYDLPTNKIIGAEALVRWRHPTKGLISPGDFVSLFEKNGFIVEVDFYVYESVMKMLQKRIADGRPVVPISMNVSRCHLGSSSFTEHLERLTEKYNIPKNIIEMEITESIFSDEDKAAVQLMDDLKKHGFTLSMDDFGSGYSSLNLLRELPIDTLKIDKAFLETTDDSEKSRIIVEEIISMAQKIKINTICEGVETEQQRDFLRQAGCQMAQGFFYARPMSKEDFEELLDSEK